MALERAPDSVTVGAIADQLVWHIAQNSPMENNLLSQRRPARQFLFDSLFGFGLIFAIAVVFIVDRRSRPPEMEYAAGGEEVETKRSLLGTTQPARRKPTPKADSVYAERTTENKEEFVKKRGGSPISEVAVQSGLDWLSRHQAQNGSWSNGCLGNGSGSCCERTSSVCTFPGDSYAVAQTGLALLAFQGGGHFTFNDTTYSTQVKRGLDWLLSTQRQDGCFLTPGRVPSMYEHAIATFALAEACAIAKDSDEKMDGKYRESLEKAINYIEVFQDPQGGGWRYTPKQPGDSSVSGWVVLALKSALAAGVKVKPEVLKKCIAFFKSIEIGQSGRTGYLNNKTLHTEATTGVGMLVHHFLLETSDSSLVANASSYLANVSRKWLVQTPEADYYLWYKCTLGMYLAGGENWDKWNNSVRDSIIRLQAKDGCERGSWKPAGMEKAGGRICSTSLAILTLEVYYRFAKKDKKLR